MTAFPSSGAMDAMAAGGGPSTILPQIVTGQPSTILSHVEQILSKAAQFASLAEELDRARTQLSQIWSGQAADSALQKIAQSLQQFQNIIKSIQDGAALLKEAAQLVQSAQTAYQTIVSSINPTVASLMSNPYTQAAAHALATSGSSMLRGLIDSIGALLKALGATKLGAVLTDIGTIVGAVQQLFGGGTSTATGTTGTATTGTSTTGTAVTAPAPVTSVASTTGQEALTGTGVTTTPTASTVDGSTAGTGMQDLLNVPGQATAGVTSGLDTTGTSDWQSSYTPSALTGTGTSTGSDGSGWIPVDGTGQSGHEATVTATDGKLSVTVQVPVDSGQPTNLDLNVSAGGDHLTEHLDIDADGTVKVS